MFTPFLISFILSLIIVYIILKRTHAKKSGWGYNKTYNTKQISLQSTFTSEMKYWAILFCILVLTTAVITQLRTTLFWVCGIGVISSFILIRNLSYAKHISFTAELKDAFSKLPYSILAFGMCFFVFATAVTQSNLVEKTIIPAANQLLQQNPIIVGIVGIFSSGILVNLLNDLPSSALLSEIISQTSNQESISHWILVQSILIGVNIGCYLTPIGALAGIVWFNLLRTERKRQEKLKEETEAKGETFVGNVAILTPTRLDLLKYGLIQFIPVALITTISSSLILITWGKLLSL
jgi:arsenical pump membrane protein